MENKNIRFSIWCWPWTSHYGGIQVCYRLCHLLNEAGYEAYMNNPGKPGWKNPIFNHSIGARDYVIYPDCIRDSPFINGRVIRYMLYYPSQYFGGVRKCTGEMIVPFNKDYFDECQQCSEVQLTEADILKIPIIEPELFFDDGRKKTINCFYHGKGGDLTDKNNTHPRHYEFLKGCTEITRTWPEKREDLAELLRNTDKLYLFDKHSAIAEEAYYCNCEVLYVNTDGTMEPFEVSGKEFLYDEPHDKENLLKQYNDLTKIHKFVDRVKDYKW